MRRGRENRLLLFLIAVASLLGTAPRLNAAVTVLHNATIIDGSGSPPRPGIDVVIDGETIVALHDSASFPHPSSARVIDCSGRFVLPGLIDMHAHLLLSPWNEKGELEARYDRPAVLQMLRTFLRFGVTTIRDPGAPTADAVLFRTLLAERKIEGPRLLTAGRILNQSSFNPEPFVTVRTPQDVRDEIAWQAAAGVDLIKVYSSMTPELVDTAIHEAHARGLAIIGHVERTTWTEAAELGIDGLEHPISWSDAYLPESDRKDYSGSLFARVYWLAHVDQQAIDQLICKLVEHHVVVDPTLMAIHTKFWGDDPRYTQSADLQYVPKKILIGWPNGRFTREWTPQQYREAQAQWPVLLGITKKMYDRGVTLVVGTDTAGPWIVPGASVHDEMRLLCDAGIPPLAVLRMATSNAAKALHLEKQIGLVAPGYQADLIVLSRDPSIAIENSRSILAVMQRGTYMPVDSELMQGLQ